MVAVNSTQVVQRVVLGVLVGVGGTAAAGALEVKVDEEDVAKSSWPSTPSH